MPASLEQQVFNEILSKRGLKSEADITSFIRAEYSVDIKALKLLPDIALAIERIKAAISNKEKIMIYGDYDIDGLTATTLLSDALISMGGIVEAYIPDRFAEGYGLNSEALKKIANTGAKLAITVDCGSTSINEINEANKIGLDVIVTDHHTVGDQLPEAIAVINPKRKDNKYPFRDFAGVGVVFKLVQALQHLGGMDLPVGQEKWLLDLVALGTVCDVVDLRDENRSFVRWGLTVMDKTRRPGLRALMKISGVKDSVNPMDLGFRLGPRLNASGRLTHAKLSLQLLQCSSDLEAESLAKLLNEQNIERQQLQKRILEQATLQADLRINDSVLVLAGEGWSHGVAGIVAAKIMEKYIKPTFVFELKNGVAKGSARSFGDFSAVDFINEVRDILITGGGHMAAAGCQLKTDELSNFRDRASKFYKSLKLKDQDQYLKVAPDVWLEDIEVLNKDLLNLINQLQPFGRSNPEPVFGLRNIRITSQRSVGKDSSHLKLTLTDVNDVSLPAIAFSTPQQENTSLAACLVKLKESNYSQTGVDLQILNMTA
jgi:single-stranded-DNA-specific exonuclease